jgi:hypothetical protein
MEEDGTGQTEGFVESDGAHKEGESLGQSHGINRDLEGARSPGGCGECRASPHCVRGI